MQYDLKPGYSPGFNPDPGSNEAIMTPPLGGCISSCQGKKEKMSCTVYSKAYDYCEYKCYGNVWNNCDGTAGVLKMLLVK